MIAALIAAGLLSALDWSDGCRPVAGSEALWRDDVRYIFVGETHGTVETPAAFADLVCAALEQGPVVVSLEYPVEFQPTLDALRVQTLLDQSRAAEMRGRTRLENGAVAVLGTLTPDERKALTPILQRKGDARRAIVRGERNDRQQDQGPSR